MITYAASRTRPGPVPAPTATLLVGIVHGPHCVVHVTAAPSRRLLMRMLARWTSTQARAKLPKPETDEVERLIRNGRYIPAMRRYFALVGSRWDPEWLVIKRVDVGREPS